jgi:predicted glycosyltransferase
MKKFLFYFGHPAQYFFLRATVRNLMGAGHKVTMLIKTKDVLEDLIKADGFEYINILPQQRGLSKTAIVFSLAKRIFAIFPILLKDRPTLLIGSDTSIALLGKLMLIKRITITEDDYHVIKKWADLTYPFTETILCPEVCDVGKFGQKKIGYAGYMKLGYLHPNVFTPDKKVVEAYQLPEKFILIRLARLTAHHDFGIQGISKFILENLIAVSKEYGYQVFISSETVLERAFDQYHLKIVPTNVHHILAHASMLISDSQSMSVEAAMLGTPSIRFSSFAGRITVLEELEHRYQLSFGVSPTDQDKLFQKLRILLSIDDLKLVFKQRRDNMLRDKIDVTKFLTWFLEEYPSSREIMQQTPDRQLEFKSIN